MPLILPGLQVLCDNSTTKFEVSVCGECLESCRDRKNEDSLFFQDRPRYRSEKAEIFLFYRVLDKILQPDHSTIFGYSRNNRDTIL